MSTDKAVEDNINPVEKQHGFKTSILILSIVLPVIGLALTYFYTINSYQYWIGLAMVVSLGGGCILRHSRAPFWDFSRKSFWFLRSYCP